MKTKAKKIKAWAVVWGTICDGAGIGEDKQPLRIYSRRDAARKQKKGYYGSVAKVLPVQISIIKKKKRC